VPRFYRYPHGRANHRTIKYEPHVWREVIKLLALIQLAGDCQCEPHVKAAVRTGVGLKVREEFQQGLSI
jgi:hypothetical protein